MSKKENTYIEKINEIIERAYQEHYEEWNDSVWNNFYTIEPDYHEPAKKKSKKKAKKKKVVKKKEKVIIHKSRIESIDND